MLAVLAATGIASPHNDSWAVKALHAAAQGGSAEANLALAHRYFMADGVPGNCQEGFRSALEVTAAMSYEAQTLMLWFPIGGCCLHLDGSGHVIWHLAHLPLLVRTDVASRMILVVLAKQRG